MDLVRLRPSRDWLVLGGSVLFGLGVVPGTLAFVFNWRSANFYRALLEGNGPAWLIVSAPFFLVQAAWALRRIPRYNSVQKKLLAGVAALMLLMFFVPPWQTAPVAGSKFLGYSPVAMGKPGYTVPLPVYALLEGRGGNFTDADWERQIPISGIVAWRILVSQLVILAIVTVPINYMLGSSRESAPRQQRAA